jgi:hypothetical protein
MPLDTSTVIASGSYGTVKKDRFHYRQSVQEFGEDIMAHDILLNFDREGKSIAGDVRESNPGPLAPKARIIPLDQHPLTGDS